MGKWKRYFEFRKDSSVRPLTLSAYGKFFEGNTSPSSTLQVVDYGCGTSGDVLHLAELGTCHVTGLDAHADAIERSRSRTAHVADRVSFVQAPFETMQLAQQYDLSISHYSLYCVSPINFPGVWSKIIQNIRVGGRFVGYFHGDQHAWTNEKESFFSRDQVKDLFPAEFDIEHLDQFVKEESNPTVGSITWHGVEVIAYRKAPPVDMPLFKQSFFKAPSLSTDQQEPQALDQYEQATGLSPQIS